MNLLYKLVCPSLTQGCNLSSASKCCFELLFHVRIACPLSSCLFNCFFIWPFPFWSITSLLWAQFVLVLLKICYIIAFYDESLTPFPYLCSCSMNLEWWHTISKLENCNAAAINSCSIQLCICTDIVLVLYWYRACGPVYC